MRRMFWGIFVMGLLSAAALGQYENGQSLGDLARSNREKQQEEQASGVTPKMITNKDLPASPSSGIPAANPAEPMTQVSGMQRPLRMNTEGGQRPFTPPGAQGNGMQGNGAQGFAGQGFAGQGSGGQGFGRQGFGGQGFGQARGGNFRGQNGGNLQERIQAQESRIAQMQARLDQANARMHPNGGTAQYEGGYQGMQSQRLEMMQQRLVQQRERLAAMQDQARREDAHTSAVEP